MWGPTHTEIYPSDLALREKRKVSTTQGFNSGEYNRILTANKAEAEWERDKKKGGNEQDVDFPIF